MWPAAALPALRFRDEYRHGPGRWLTSGGAAAIVTAMNIDIGDSVDMGPGPRKRTTLGGVLAEALNMEDDISGGVYLDYLDRQRWPAQISDDVFDEIHKRLTVLVRGISKHRKILQALVREHG